MIKAARYPSYGYGVDIEPHENFDIEVRLEYDPSPRDIVSGPQGTYLGSLRYDINPEQPCFLTLGFDVQSGDVVKAAIADVYKIVPAKIWPQ